ncbi:hypothetical protein [Pokkaliibacter plantistimulans]|uniref:hypothetical protein n=1 Tax=Pokkaliibacter plantistimulans TaxID=1635171 RepID=UPI000D74F225|nr:hypothetical protein [Pokkaliibacter plantistimulans]
MHPRLRLISTDNNNAAQPVQSSLLATTLHTPLQHLRNDPVIKRFFDQVPAHVADSFDEHQLRYIRLALNSRAWGNHSIDMRGTLAFPFLPKQLYFVLLMGLNRRGVSKKEKWLSMLFTSASVLGFGCFCVLLGALVTYLANSATAVDQLPPELLDLWDWLAMKLGWGIR